MNTTIYQDELDQWFLVWKQHIKRSGTNQPGSFEALSKFIDMAELAFPRLIAEFDRLKRGESGVQAFHNRFGLDRLEGRYGNQNDEKGENHEK